MLYKINYRLQINIPKKQLSMILSEEGVNVRGCPLPTPLA